MTTTDLNTKIGEVKNKTLGYFKYIITPELINLLAQYLKQS